MGEDTPRSTETSIYTGYYFPGADVGRMKTPWGADVFEDKQDGGVGDCCRSHDEEQTIVNVCMVGKEGIVSAV